MENSKEQNAKTNENVLHVSLHEDELSALLTILNYIKEEDTIEPRKDGKQAEKIMDVIFTYRKPYKRNDGKGYTICLFESQAASMIKFFANTIQMIMQPGEDSSGK